MRCTHRPDVWLHSLPVKQNQHLRLAIGGVHVCQRIASAAGGLSEDAWRQIWRFTTDSNVHEGMRQSWRWRMKVSGLLRLLYTDGWFLVATRGSHRQFKRLAKLR